MRKIFVLTILLAAMLAGGCDTSKMTVESTNDNEIKITAENADKDVDDSNGRITLGDGEILFGEAKIERGRLEMRIGDKIYTFDKTQDISIELPPGKHDILFGGRDGFTGEMTLRALPEI